MVIRGKTDQTEILLVYVRAMSTVYDKIEQTASRGCKSPRGGNNSDAFAAFGLSETLKLKKKAPSFRFEPSSKRIFTDRSKAVLLLWIVFVSYASCCRALYCCVCSF